MRSIYSRFILDCGGSVGLHHLDWNLQFHRLRIQCFILHCWMNLFFLSFFEHYFYLLWQEKRVHTLWSEAKFNGTSVKTFQQMRLHSAMLFVYFWPKKRRSLLKSRFKIPTMWAGTTGVFEVETKRKKVLSY